ncbi:MAG: ImmA/IrrE family metallo-endopeptidase, partial [Nitrososphaeria archaeon]
MVKFFTRGKGPNRKVIPITEKKVEAGIRDPRIMETPEFQEASKDELEKLARDELKKIAEMNSVDAMLMNLKQYAGLLGTFSAYNSILIRKQDPDVTRVMSKDDWKRLGYDLRKNASPIAILVPYGVPKKYSDAKIAKMIEKMKEQGQSEEYIMSKLNEMLEKNKKKYRAYVFGVGRVYDAKSVKGNVPPEEHYKNSMLYEAMKRGAMSNLEFNIVESTLDNARGITQNHEKKIIVMKVPNESKEALNTLAHELSHAILNHDYAKQPRWKVETEAELSAFLVLAHYNVDFEKE